MNLRPYPYQAQALADVRAAYSRGARSVVLVMPCAAGKTVVFAHAIKGAVARGRRAWVGVHRRELKDQAVQKLRDVGLDVGIIAPGHPPYPRHFPHVASIDTLASWIKRGRMPHPPPDLTVFDEGHHCIASQWSKYLEWTGGHGHNLLVTATPCRHDGRGLGEVADEMVLGPSVAELIAQGYISDYRYFAPDDIDMSGTRRGRGGDYTAEGLSEAMAREGARIYGSVVQHYLEHTPGWPALAFYHSVAEAQRQAAEFRAAGVSAQCVDGKMPGALRRQYLRDLGPLGEKPIQVITSCSLIGEGLDVPSVSAIFLARPTASLAVFLQQVGRGARVDARYPLTFIFDHVGNWRLHGLPDDEREWSLEGRVKRQAAALTAMPYQCPPPCNAINKATVVRCWKCGKLRPVKEQEGPERVEGALRELDREEARQVREEARKARLREEWGCRTLAELIALGEQRAYRPAWAYRRWDEMQRKRAERERAPVVRVVP